MVTQCFLGSCLPGEEAEGEAVNGGETVGEEVINQLGKIRATLILETAEVVEAVDIAESVEAMVIEEVVVIAEAVQIVEVVAITEVVVIMEAKQTKKEHIKDHSRLIMTVTADLVVIHLKASTEADLISSVEVNVGEEENIQQFLLTTMCKYCCSG